MKSDHGLDSSLEHDLFRKTPVSPFPDHAPASSSTFVSRPPRFACARNGAHTPGLAARFFAPEFCQTAKTKASRTNKGEAERRKAQGVDSAGSPTSVAARHCVRRGARPKLSPSAACGGGMGGGGSPSGALPRLSPRLSPWLSPVPRFMAAPTGFCPVRHPGSQLLADLRRGRPGEFPNRPGLGVTSPIPGTAPAPLQGSSREASPMIR